MLATNHAREQTHDVAMALRADRTILGLRDTIYADLGDAYPVGGLASIVTTPMFVPGATGSRTTRRTYTASPPTRRRSARTAGSGNRRPRSASSA